MERSSKYSKCLPASAFPGSSRMAAISSSAEENEAEKSGPFAGPSADHPAGGGETHLRAVHVGIKARTDRFDDASTSLIVGLLKDHPDGTELCEVRNQRVLRQRALHVERTKLDLGPTALFQNSAHA